MKYLGIDYGTKYTGIALSDDEGSLAFAREVIPTRDDLLDYIVKCISKEGVGCVVLGESLNLTGIANPLQEKIHVLGNLIKERAGVSVVYEPEFMTSVQAHRQPDAPDRVDASAAALILQSYLEKVKKKKH